MPQRLTIYAMVVHSMPSQIKLFSLSHFGIKTMHWVPSLNMQFLENWARKWETKYLDTRFPLPTLLIAGYSVNLIIFFLPFFYILTNKLELGIMPNCSIILQWKYDNKSAFVVNALWTRYLLLARLYYFIVDSNRQWIVYFAAIS